MATSKLGGLRAQRATIHQAVARLEPRVAAYQARLVEVETAIHATSPELTCRADGGAEIRSSDTVR